MKKILLSLTFLLAIAVAAGAWIYRPIAATHPALTSAELPPIIPLREFYANPSTQWRHQLSPDGKNLSWLESKSFKAALWVKPLEGDDRKIFHTDDEVRGYAWSSDSRYLIYQADRDGWENDVLVSIDTQNPDAQPRTYEFGKDVKSFFVQVPDNGKDHVIIAHNGRDRKRFDLFNLNLTSGETTSLGVAQDQNILWHISNDGDIYARTRQYDGGNWTFELDLGGLWKPLVRGGQEDQFSPLGTWDKDDQFYALSNMGRDKVSLIKFDIKSRQETVVYASNEVDLSWVMTNPENNEPRIIFSEPGNQKLEIRDPELASIIANIKRPEGSKLNIHSITTDQSKILFSVEEANAGFETRMIDKASGKVTVVSTPPIARYRDQLSLVEPVTIPARDGLKTPAYLSRPQGVKNAAPLVIFIHGGPIARVFGGWNSFRQMLNNRGYAVLDVNYRASSGYGRVFKEAGIGEVSRAMDDDISDARAWAVNQGIADPEKVAVLGGSFGGLKVLTAMTRNPKLYAAGIDINGISDLVSMRKEIPPYWAGWDFWYDKYLGNPNNPEERKIIKDRSPLTHAANLNAPLMIIQGSNDVRVIRSQSDRMVEALRAAGRPVEYLLLDGAGHQSRNWGWKTRMKTYRKMERFLAKHLGGRADGFDYALLGAQVLPKAIGGN